LAERLGKIVPGAEAKRVYFGNSGTEAVEAAIKLARYATRREKLIAFYGCFHGRTLGALSLTASKAAQRKGFGTLLGGVIHIPYPYAYRCPYGHAAESCGSEIIEFLEGEVFKRMADPEEIAAIVIEPIQGEGGYVPAPKTFLVELQRVARKHGILLVVDEVQSGMGRTGKWWASDHAGIEPDILCTAKGIASGMPLGAMIARASVMNWKPGAHASTFGGNPVSIAAAQATLDLLEGGLIENARRMGEHLFAKMSTWPARFPNVGDVRGKGLMIGIELVKDKKTKEPARPLRDALVHGCFERGLLMLGCGRSSTRIMPPLMLPRSLADEGLAIFEDALTEAEKSNL
jgi:4-aminobutyrate aminotransferase